MKASVICLPVWLFSRVSSVTAHSIAMAKKQKNQVASVSTPNAAWFPLLAMTMAMMPQHAPSNTKVKKKVKSKQRVSRVVQPSGGEPTEALPGSFDAAAGASADEIADVAPLVSEPSVNESSPLVSDPMEAAFHEASHRTPADFAHLAPLPRYFDSFDWGFELSMLKMQKFEMMNSR